MKKCFKIILSIFVLVLTFVAGFQTANLRNEGKWKLEQKNNQSGIDLKLPGENEKSITMLLLCLFKALKFALLLQGLQVSFRARQPVLPCD